MKRSRNARKHMRGQQSKQKQSRRDSPDQKPAWRAWPRVFYQEVVKMQEKPDQTSAIVALMDGNAVIVQLCSVWWQERQHNQTWCERKWNRSQKGNGKQFCKNNTGRASQCCLEHYQSIWYPQMVSPMKRQQDTSLPRNLWPLPRVTTKKIFGEASVTSLFLAVSPWETSTAHQKCASSYSKHVLMLPPFCFCKIARYYLANSGFSFCHTPCLVLLHLLPWHVDNSRSASLSSIHIIWVLVWIGLFSVWSTSGGQTVVTRSMHVSGQFCPLVLCFCFNCCSFVRCLAFMLRFDTFDLLFSTFRYCPRVCLRLLSCSV